MCTACTLLIFLNYSAFCCCISRASSFIYFNSGKQFNDICGMIVYSLRHTQTICCSHLCARHLLFRIMECIVFISIMIVYILLYLGCSIKFIQLLILQYLYAVGWVAGRHRDCRSPSPTVRRNSLLGYPDYTRINLENWPVGPKSKVVGVVELIYLQNSTAAYYYFQLCLFGLLFQSDCRLHSLSQVNSTWPSLHGQAK